MNIHEYQAKAVLSSFGVPVLSGKPALSVNEAVQVAERLGGPVWVVKAQIHAGGRGKGGGVKVVHSIDEVRAEAERMLGMTLITHQTGPAGRLVKRLFVEDGCAIARELYLSCLVDRGSSKVAFIASTEGGMDIEEVASKTPEKILTITVDPASGIMPFHGRRIAFALGLEGDQVKQCIRLIDALYRAVVSSDAGLLEINPLVLSEDGQLVCLDAKMNFDSNALFRQKEIAALRDFDEEDSAEVEASKFGLNYVTLDGEIGCMVNGAGLAMATMDIIKHSGGEPANFLDVGGGADEEKIENGFRILLSDPHVKGIFINIFGGILRCDILARGVEIAAKKLKIKIPIVVRMEGTNMEEGHQILSDSGIDVIVAEGMKDGAQKIVKAIR